MKRRNELAALEALMDQYYETGRQHGLYGRPKALGTFSRYVDMAYSAGWHDGHNKRRGITARLREDADMTAAVDEMIAEVQS